MVKFQKYGLLIVLVFVLSFILYTNSYTLNNTTKADLNNANSFGDWREDNASVSGCLGFPSCHLTTGGNVEGLGSLTISASNQAYTSLEYQTSIKITGFMDAAGNSITIGFISYYENNSDFISTGNHKKAIDVAIDGSGDSSDILINLTAPTTTGNYTIKAHAIYSAIGLDFYYLTNTSEVEVVQPPDSDPPIIEYINFNGTEWTNGTKIGGEFLLEANATDEFLAGIRYSLNGSDYIDLQKNENPIYYSSNVDIADFDNGTIILIINAYDAAQNQVNQTYNFEVENIRGSRPNTDIVSFYTNKLINISDGQIDPIWEDFESEKFLISEFGTGGYLLSAQNDFYMYVLLVFNSENKWISIEFDAILGQDDHMLDGHDSWTFGSDHYGDNYFVGAIDGSPKSDVRNDILYEKFSDDTYTYIEMIRPLDTKDIEGHDVVFNATTVLDVQFASSVSHVTGHLVYTWTISELTPSGGTTTTTPDGGTPARPGELSDLVFVFSFTMVIFTGLIHAGLRVISKPIKHDKRIVQVDQLPNQSGLRDFIRRRRASKKE